MQAGIEKLHIKGRIRITFDPLVSKLPVIGAIKVPSLCQPFVWLFSGDSCCPAMSLVKPKALLVTCMLA